jgi:hypothetical protein
MRSVDRLIGVVALLALGACASAPPVVSKPVEAVQQAVTAAATVVTAAVPVVAETPVAPEAQRAFDAAKAHLRAGRMAEAERGFRDVAACCATRASTTNRSWLSSRQ